MDMQKEKYLTIPQVAKLLGISRIAVYKKVKNGQIKAEKIGRNYAIPREIVRIAQRKKTKTCKRNSRLIRLFAKRFQGIRRNISAVGTGIVKNNNICITLSL